MPTEKQMTLKTRSSGLGQHCVERDPPKIKAKRSDVDVIRLTNINSSDSGRVITVSIDTTEAAKLFDPPVNSSTALNPGESLTWKVKATIVGQVGVNVRTNPDATSVHDNCTAV